MYFLNAILLCFVVVTTSKSDKNILFKFKSDIDKVGRDFETLVFDIVKKVVDDVSAYQVDGDYYTSEEDTSREKTTTEHSITKKILEDNLENTTETYATEKADIATPTLLRKFSNKLLQNRLKRSVDEKNASSLPEHKQLVSDSPNSNNDHLYPSKSIEEHALEQLQIEDLKEEINKLHDLVILLRDQQRVISLLDKNTSNFDVDLSSRFDTKNLLKLLDYVNNRDINDQKDTYSTFNKKRDEDGGKTTTHEELAKIKEQLKEVIETLNKTTNVLATEKRKELLIEKALSDQKLDINFLKMIVKRLYHNMDFNKENFGDDILGTVQHLPKELPHHNAAKVLGEKGNVNKSNERTRETVELINEKSKLESRHEGRASELDDLERLLHRLNQPKKTDSRMFELQREMDKNKQEPDVDVIKQLKFLQKYLEQKKEHQSINTLPSSESEMIKRLQNALKMDGGKNRALDDDIELELQKLQQEIDDLRPKDPLDLNNNAPTSDQTRSDFKQFQTMFNQAFGQPATKEQEQVKRFQMMLNKMVNQEAKKEDDPSKQFQIMLNQMANQGKNDGISDPGVKGQNVLLKEIIELRKQLASVGKPKVTAGNFYSADGGYNYDPDAAVVHGKWPYQVEHPAGGYGNFAANYPPYTNPRYQNLNQNLNNRMPIAPSDARFTSYLPPSDYIPSNLHNHNFDRTYSYFKSMPGPYEKPYEGNLHQNGPYELPDQRNLEVNYHQYSLERPTRPEPFSIGPSVDQNSYQYPPDYPKPFGVPSPPFRYNFETNPDASSLQPPQKAYQTLLPPTQHNFGAVPYHVDSAASSVVKPSIPYTQMATSNQNFMQPDERNQFFPSAQQSEYTKSVPEPPYPPQGAPGNSAGQSGAYPPKAASSVDYIYQKVEDLRAQIYNLQSVIDGLNKPNYTQTPEDRETVFGLERQISELKGVINSMTPDINSSNYVTGNPSNIEPNRFSSEHQLNYPSKSTKRRSIENNGLGFNGDPELYDQVVSGLKRLIFENQSPNQNRPEVLRSSYDDIQKRINDLKYQLETKTHHSNQRHFSPILPSYTYQPPYHQHNHFAYTPPKINGLELFKSNKNDLFTSIVTKILDKVIAATPAVLEKLFGSGITELSNFGDYSTYGDNYNVGYKGQNDIQNLFKSLGFFGYGPLIILKIIDGFTTFVKILKKNTFFKNFLLPALILLIVAGAVVFLIWWLQPEVEYNGINQNYPTAVDPSGYYAGNNDKYGGRYSNYDYEYRSNGYSNNNNNYSYGGSYRPLVYSRSYLDDGRDRSSFV